MADEKYYKDDYEDDFDPDDFDDDSLPYVNNYPQQETENKFWIPMLTAGLAVVALAVGVAWYSLSSDLAELEEQLAAMPRITPGVAEHDHPPGDELVLLESQILELAEQVRLQQEVIELFREPPAPEPQPEAAAGAEPATPAATAPVELPRGPGQWLINLGSFRQQEKAASWAESLTADGYPIEVAQAQSGGSTVYRVRVTGLPDRDEAQRVVEMMQEKHKLKGIWVTRISKP